MERDRASLVFDEETGLMQHGLVQLMHHVSKIRVILRIAKRQFVSDAMLETMEACNIETAWRECPIEKRDRPSADDSERAIQPLLQTRQDWQQGRVDCDRLGPLDDIRERAVEIKEQRTFARRRGITHRLKRASGFRR